MYNFFKHQETVRQEEAERRNQELYSEWLTKNESIKQEAKEKLRLKFQDWMCDQIENGISMHFEDDHYQQWRKNKQFRDVENQPNFKGYKTFRHKPNYDMDKFFSERERRELQELSSRKQKLVDSSLINEAQRSRSLRSQGPLNPKLSFRPIEGTKENKIQPKMRFTNITDKERMRETHHTFDDKFKSLYSSFEMTKSKIGVPKVNKRNQSQTKSRRYDFDIETERSYRTRPVHKIHFEVPMPEEETVNQESLAFSKQLQPASKEPPQNPSRPLRKTYFKLAKTMELEGCKKIKAVLQESQYDRRKDMSNIRANMTCQNYFKRPVI